MTTENKALLVIDVQRGFDKPVWGPRNNPGAEANIKALVDAWQERGLPIVLVHHDSVKPGSSLRPGQEGNHFKPELDGVRADLVFGKKVNSAFHGDIDLDGWLKTRGITSFVLAGIQTNFCCETTARVGGNLGYDVTFALDATFTFDLAGPDGGVLTADELAKATATNLHGGGFATVTSTKEILSALQ
ncbi:Nicotinamidase-related amidase [Amycolatopsis lurida]|uniref:Isochorismatase n=1 Tax=Amycolatopsis lurida NRRL 2430 TaxID=1460371 RepID=A0A2P2FX06_AMYLU|nr:cysteine hydrolase family protein [Amycolatopsis lurida]KFU81268.1 isochorismatase [Amycolatopsis lurida NRRL 2430]SEE16070.1 Nicotinamidase-related amidase [Amycolatopsis lurida]